jgi:hypothetical protein
MSGIVSLTLQRLRETLGAETTSDERFNSAVQDVSHLWAIVFQIQQHVTAYVDSLATVATLGTELADTFKAFYEKSPDRMCATGVVYGKLHSTLEEKIHQLVCCLCWLVC